MAAVLVDTGIWYSLFDPNDGYAPRSAANGIADELANHDVILPWPVTYETLCTKFTKRHESMLRFDKLLRSPRTKQLDDSRYRQDALEDCFAFFNKARPMSLVDCLLRRLIADKEVRIAGFYTYNPGDFADVCRVRGIELRPGY